MDFKKVYRNKKKSFVNRKLVFTRLTEKGYASLEKYADDHGITKSVAVKDLVENGMERENYFVKKWVATEKENRKLEEQDNG